MKKIKLNTVICGIFLLLAVGYFAIGMGLRYWSNQYAPGPGFIPRWVGGAMIVLSLIAFIQSFKQEGITLDEVLPKDKKCRINLYVTWGSLIFFLVFVKKIGFMITGSIVLSALFSRGTPIKKAIPLAIIVTLVCFLVFKVLLQVQVPTNRFGW